LITDVLESDAYCAFFKNLVVMNAVFVIFYYIASVVTDAGSATADSVGSVYNSHIRATAKPVLCSCDI